MRRATVLAAACMVTVGCGPSRPTMSAGDVAAHLRAPLEHVA